MVTDRTAADVETAKMLIKKIQSGQTLTTSEKTAIERGTCTYTMLNRIEAKQKELVELLNGYGYMVSIDNKINWKRTDLYTKQNHDRLLNNLNNLKDAYYTYQGTPTTPDYLFNYTNANDVEKILVDIENIIDDMVTRFRECNTFYCGEVNNL